MHQTLEKRQYLLFKIIVDIQNNSHKYMSLSKKSNDLIKLIYR